jgi:DNA-binding response OmpR family regulator
MRVLIAEDDPVARRILEVTLAKCDYEVVVTTTGWEAWKALRKGAGPEMVVLDWMMPGMDGVEICRRVRGCARTRSTYIILLTARSHRQDLITGLDAGADDYVVKPFDPDELRARLRVGARVLDLQARLADRVRDLEQALAHVKQLRGLLPICAYCKKVRDDRDYWEQLDTYIMKHSDAQFSHGICPECFAKLAEAELNQ